MVKNQSSIKSGEFDGLAEVEGTANIVGYRHKTERPGNTEDSGTGEKTGR